MRTIAIAAVLAIGLAVPELAVAQAGRPAGGTVGPTAPVGHRQPSTKDVPQGQGAQPAQMSKEDRALEKALKGICRGC
jgi:hypothetical protein